MVNYQQIVKVASQMAAAANASRVILFGSYARGDARRDSDVDLMIIAESSLPRYKRAVELYKLLRPYPFGMDLVVYTPQEVEQGRQSSVSFVSTVLREGKTIYDRRPDRSGQAVARQSQE